jgi:hypothetical protein
VFDFRSGFLCTSWSASIRTSPAACFVLATLRDTYLVLKILHRMVRRMQWNLRVLNLMTMPNVWPLCYAVAIEICDHIFRFP